jgi:hypothetical protein
MNDNEKLEILLNFITNCAKNVHILMKNTKDIKDVKELKIELAEYGIMFSRNLKELTNTLEENEENGSVEH